MVGLQKKVQNHPSLRCVLCCLQYVFPILCLSSAVVEEIMKTSIRFLKDMLHKPKTTTFWYFMENDYFVFFRTEKKGL